MHRVHPLLPLSLMLVFAVAAHTAPGAGFGLYEGGARGNALGGLAGRADDPSALFFNPAGITQLEGSQVMGGLTLIAPMTDVQVTTPAGKVTTTTERNYWMPPHLYGTYQVNDSVWAGLGIYSRFGLGTEFDSEWPGRFNSYNAVIQSLSFNPNVALKVNDKLSVAAGVSAMWFDLELERKLPGPAGELDFSLTGDSIGYGFNGGIRYEVTEKVALGASYQSTVKQEVEGDASIRVAKSSASGDVKLPDMIFFGIAVEPTDRVSVEVGTIYTGWSSYDELKVKIDDPTLLGKTEVVSEKDWDDVWRYYAGVEYAVNEAWDVRLGYTYDPSPIPDRTADYLVPANDRHLVGVGCGYKWESWKLDLSYTYLSIQDRTIKARPAEGVFDSKFENGDAHMVGVSLSKAL